MKGRSRLGFVKKRSLLPRSLKNWQDHPLTSPRLESAPHFEIESSPLHTSIGPVSSSLALQPPPHSPVSSSPTIQPQQASVSNKSGEYTCVSIQTLSTDMRNSLQKNHIQDLVTAWDSNLPSSTIIKSSMRSLRRRLPFSFWAPSWDGRAEQRP